jgi:hypothetical protein
MNLHNILTIIIFGLIVFSEVAVLLLEVLLWGRHSETGILEN